MLQRDESLQMAFLRQQMYCILFMIFFLMKNCIKNEILMKNRGKKKTHTLNFHDSFPDSWPTTELVKCF